MVMAQVSANILDKFPFDYKIIWRESIKVIYESLDYSFRTRLPPTVARR